MFPSVFRLERIFSAIPRGIWKFGKGAKILNSSSSCKCCVSCGDGWSRIGEEKSDERHLLRWVCSVRKINAFFTSSLFPSLCLSLARFALPFPQVTTKPSAYSELRWSDFVAFLPSCTASCVYFFLFFSFTSWCFSLLCCFSRTLHECMCTEVICFWVGPKNLVQVAGSQVARKVRLPPCAVLLSFYLTFDKIVIIIPYACTWRYVENLLPSSSSWRSSFDARGHR